MTAAREVARPRYPSARRLDLSEEIHGHRVADPYRWLEDPADPQTRAWSAWQDALFADARETWADREAWLRSLERAFAQTVTGVPCPRGRGEFFLRRDPGCEHDVLCLSEPNGRLRVLVDPTRLDPAGTTALDGFAPSPSGHLVSYQASHAGTETSSIYVLDSDTCALIDGPIGRTRYPSVAWLPDGRAFYYTDALPETAGAKSPPPQRIRLHRVGAAADRDQTVFTAPGTGWRMVHRLTLSADGRWLSAAVRRGPSSAEELWISGLAEDGTRAARWRRLTLSGGTQATIRFGRTDNDAGVRAFLHTTNGAPRGRICATVAGDGAWDAWDAWDEVISEDPGTRLTAFAVLDGPQLDFPLLAVVRERLGSSELTVCDARTGTEVGQVELPGCGTIPELSVRPEGGHELWFTYTDFTTQPTVYHHDVLTRVTSSAPFACPAAAVHVRQVSYASGDGTAVGMFILAPEKCPSRPRPTMLTAYGGFGVSMGPAFAPTILPWIQAGGVCAIAGVRGGGEGGDTWHRDGAGARKPNAIADLHAAGDWLVADGCTTREQLGIVGSSNGGLLVAAAVTQHPERYAAAVCVAPLTDMVRYERFGLGPAWVKEYGSAADPEQFSWLIGYSPYHHARHRAHYPAVFIASFEEDTRVDPMHARKLIAALQHATASSEPILLRRESDAGHGQRSVSRVIDLSADVLAFLADRLNLHPPSDAARTPRSR